jgi:DNA polymerase
LFGEKRKDGDWTWEAVDSALDLMKSKSLDLVEYIFGDAVLTISGCIRGLFVAGEGKDLIASDYSAIEAVVAAQLAGEEWRLETFRNKIDIYLASASQITGTTLEEYAAYHKDTGAKHPDRQKIGKVAELALGYQGGLGAWRNFDKTDTYTDDQVYGLIRAWREKSPAIVEMWGGQTRNYQPYFYGLEGMAILAVTNPGARYSYRSVAYECIDDKLYCVLPSGRRLTYHQPRILPSLKRQGQMELSFMGYNSNPAMGAIGWVRIATFGGRLFENVVQAVSRDIMRDATNRLERAGYNIVLRVHDELVAEVPENWGSIEEFEAMMSLMPVWAAGYPVRAAGGWSGKRYRKD